MGLKDDLRHAGRRARRHAGFSTMVVAATALGVGLNTAVFSLVVVLVLRPPAVTAPERLARVYSSVSGDFLSHAPMAFPDYEALRDRARSFAGLAASDLDALLAAVSLLAIAAVVAGFLPAWSAAHLDPASALRRE